MYFQVWTFVSSAVAIRTPGVWKLHVTVCGALSATTTGADMTQMSSADKLAMGEGPHIARHVLVEAPVRYSWTGYSAMAMKEHYLNVRITAGVSRHQRAQCIGKTPESIVILGVNDNYCMNFRFI